ncbi:MAG TPA: hypothetical protein DHW02_02595 [Ktedonobacter sp.]|nr:hypothetical protein [Ktedonobacter sp.]
MSNRETVMTFVTALQSGDISLAANSMADNFTLTGFAANVLDKNEFLLMQSKLLAAMPDFSYNLSDVQDAENDSVQALIQITGTQANGLDLSQFGMRPVESTGLAVTLPQVHVTYDVENGLITSIQIESLPGSGMAGLAQQVGAELPIARRGVNIAD